MTKPKNFNSMGFTFTKRLGNRILEFSSELGDTYNSPVQVLVEKRKKSNRRLVDQFQLQLVMT